jgi:hypothetical protein
VTLDHDSTVNFLRGSSVNPWDFRFLLNIFGRSRISGTPDGTREVDLEGRAGTSDLCRRRVYCDDSVYYILSISKAGPTALWLCPCVILILHNPTHAILEGLVYCTWSSGPLHVQYHRRNKLDGWVDRDFTSDMSVGEVSVFQGWRLQDPQTPQALIESNDTVIIR